MPTCKLCNQEITEGQRWEYATSYAVRTPEEQKERVHSGCVAKQLREVLTMLAAVPEKDRDDLYIEIEGIVRT